jgi:hypothetical protein
LAVSLGGGTPATQRSTSTTSGPANLTGLAYPTQTFAQIPLVTIYSRSGVPLASFGKNSSAPGVTVGLNQQPFLATGGLNGVLKCVSGGCSEVSMPDEGPRACPTWGCDLRENMTFQATGEYTFSMTSQSAPLSRTTNQTQFVVDVVKTIPGMAYPELTISFGGTTRFSVYLGSDHAGGGTIPLRFARTPIEFDVEGAGLVTATPTMTCVWNGCPAFSEPNATGSGLWSTEVRFTHPDLYYFQVTTVMDSSVRVSTGMMLEVPDNSSGVLRDAIGVGTPGSWVLASVPTHELDAGSSLVVSMDVLNTYGSDDNLTAQQNWAWGPLTDPHFNALAGCSVSQPPFSLVILMGSYGLNNFTSASPLQLVGQNGPTSCNTNVPHNQFYDFLGSSDQAIVCSYSSGCLDTIAGHSQIDGFWLNSAFQKFPAGSYTVVAGDEWGNLAFEHFEMLPP